MNGSVFQKTLPTLLLILFLGVSPALAQTKLLHFSYGSHGDAWHNYLRTMAAQFKEQTGIEVELLISSGAADYREKLLTLIAIGDAPDTTDAHPGLGAPFAAMGAFADLRPYMERDGFPVEQVPPSVWEGVRNPEDGAIWGVPVSILPIITFYNEDLFSQAGLTTPGDMGDDWTWETVQEAAKRLTYDRNGDGQMDVYGTARIHFRWEMPVHQAGGMLYDRLIFPTESRFNTPEVLAAIEYLQQLVAIDKVNSPNTRTHDFHLGNVGFVTVDGPSVIGNTLRGVPFSWDVARQPLGPASRAARVNPDGFQILNDSKNKAAAWQWIRFLTDNVENQLQMAELTGRFPSLRDAMVQYPSFTPTLPSNWQVILDTAFDPNGYPAYVVGNASAIEPFITAQLNRVWNGTDSAAVALQIIHETVSVLLDM